VEKTNSWPPLRDGDEQIGSAEFPAIISSSRGTPRQLGGGGECLREAVFVRHVCVELIAAGGKRRQGVSNSARLRGTGAMGKGILLLVVHQKKMHQFAMVRNERRPSAAAFRCIHGDSQNRFLALGPDLSRHREWFVESELLR